MPLGGRMLKAAAVAATLTACLGAAVPGLAPQLGWYQLASQPFTVDGGVGMSVAAASNVLGNNGALLVPNPQHFVPLSRSTEALCIGAFFICNISSFNGCGTPTGASLHSTFGDDGELFFHLRAAEPSLARQRSAVYHHDIGAQTTVCMLGGEMAKPNGTAGDRLMDTASVVCSLDGGWSWRAGEPLPVAVAGAAAVVHAAHVYMIGGLKAAANTTDAWDICAPTMVADLDAATGMPVRWRVLWSAPETPWGCRTRLSAVLLTGADMFSLEDPTLAPFPAVFPAIYIAGGLPPPGFPNRVRRSSPPSPLNAASSSAALAAAIAGAAAAGDPLLSWDGSWFAPDMANLSSWTELGGALMPALAPEPQNSADDDDMSGGSYGALTTTWVLSLNDPDYRTSTLSLNQSMVSIDRRNSYYSMDAGVRWSFLPVVTAQAAMQRPLPFPAASTIIAATVLQEKNSGVPVIITWSGVLTAAYPRLCNAESCGAGRFARGCDSSPWTVVCSDCRSCVDGFELQVGKCSTGPLLASNTDTACRLCTQCNSSTESVVTPCSSVTGEDTVCGPKRSPLPPGVRPQQSSLVTHEGVAAFQQGALIAAGLLAAGVAAYSGGTAVKAPAARRRAACGAAARAAASTTALLGCLAMLRASQVVFVGYPSPSSPAAEGVYPAASNMARMAVLAILLLVTAATQLMLWLLLLAVMRRADMVHDRLALQASLRSPRGWLHLASLFAAAALHPLAASILLIPSLPLSDKPRAFLARWLTAFALLADVSTAAVLNACAWNPAYTLQAVDGVTVTAIITSSLLALTALTLLAAPRMLRATVDKARAGGDGLDTDALARAELVRRLAVWGGVPSPSSSSEPAGGGGGAATGPLQSVATVSSGALSYGRDGSSARESTMHLSPLHSHGLNASTYSTASGASGADLLPVRLFGDHPSGLNSSNGSDLLDTQSPVPLLVPRPIRPLLPPAVVAAAGAATAANAYRSAFRAPPTRSGDGTPISTRAAAVAIMAAPPRPPTRIGGGGGYSTPAELAMGSGTAGAGGGSGGGAAAGGADDSVWAGSWGGAASRAGMTSTAGSYDGGLGLGFVSPHACASSALGGATASGSASSSPALSAISEEPHNTDELLHQHQHHMMMMSSDAGDDGDGDLSAGGDLLSVSMIGIGIGRVVRGPTATTATTAAPAVRGGAAPSLDPS